ncbi:MAG TPA: MarR family transcriptional regulator [Herpetosiphonaceae bacterium]
MHELKSKITFLLMKIYKAHRQRAEAALSTLGLHAGQEMILFQLWMEDGLPQSRLVERMGVEPPTVTKMLQRMEKCELVERNTCANDARVSRVYLTDKGRALEAEVKRIWEELDAQTLAGLDEEQRATLRQLLLLVQANVGPVQPPAASWPAPACEE